MHTEQPAVLIINGPNLNMLGVREPGIYGTATLGDIEARCEERAEALELAVDFRQSNVEGEIVSWIQEARTAHDGIIINAGGYSHTSVAILDALLTANLPVIEVHLSNPYRREAFRHFSYVSQAATGLVCGLGARGYLLALDAMSELISGEEP